MSWQLGRALFVNSTFHDERFLVIDAKRRTPFMSRETTSRDQLVGRRDDARPFLRDRPAGGFEIVELVLPADLTAQDGSTFEGSVYFEFTFNESQDQWIITSIGVFGASSGIVALVPPI